jgi:hypothetical protein
VYECRHDDHHEQQHDRHARTQQNYFAQQIGFHQVISAHWDHPPCRTYRKKLDAETTRDDAQVPELTVACTGFAVSHDLTEHSSLLGDARDKTTATGCPTSPLTANLEGEDCDMLWTVFVVLLVLWLLGLVSSYTLGGFIHILLVLALVVLVINLLSGRRTAL